MGVHIRALAPIASGGGGGTSGTVTSVGLSLPASVFSISGSPVTVSGTLTGSFQTQSSAQVFAGPASGAPVAPVFRTLVSADIPAINLATSGPGGVTGTLSSGQLGVVNLATSGVGGVTGTLPSSQVGVINLATSGVGGVTGTLPGANMTASNLASTGNGGVTGTLPGANIAAINLATSGNGGVTGTLSGANMSPTNLGTTGNGGSSGGIYGYVLVTANRALFDRGYFGIQSTSAYLLTMPAPTMNTSFYLKDVSGTLGTNTTTLQATSAGTTGNVKIEGSTANKILQTNFGGYFFFADGTSWWEQ